MNLAPIVLFIYNRPWHTQQTLEALEKNDLAQDSILYIYADGAKENSNEEQIQKIQKVRKLIRQAWEFKEINIIEREKNWGLADNIVDGVTKVVNKYGKIIVLEDDIVTSVGFLKYMNDALHIYKDEEKVMHISAYVPLTFGANLLPDTYFLRFMNCWGWASWKNSWGKLNTDIDLLNRKLKERSDFVAFNLEGSINMCAQIKKNISKELNTWAIKWYSTIFLENGLCLYPKKSLVAQIGMDGTGEHCKVSTQYDVDVIASIVIRKIQVRESTRGKSYLKRFYKYGTVLSLNHFFFLMIYKKKKKIGGLLSKLF